MLYFMGHIFPYIAAAVFLWGMAYKLCRWLTVPSPFPVTTFPVPRSSSGRLMVFLQEMLLFNSLYRHNKVLWLFSWMMHAALGFIIAGHIAGIYFLGEQFIFFGMSRGGSLALSHSLGMAAGVVFITGLLGLMGRRLYAAEARATSDLSNYMELGLLAGIALTGMGLRWVMNAQDLIPIREYIAGLILFRPAAMPESPWFFWHFCLVNILIMVLPYSKLVHWLGGGMIRLMLIETPPEYPTAAGKPLRTSFAGLAADDRFGQSKSTISLR